MRKIWQGLIKFLREPAIETGIAIVMLVIAVLSIRWGIVRGWFTILYFWFGDSHMCPNWLMLLLILLLFFFFGSWVITRIRKANSRKAKYNYETTYHKIWGVLWGWPPKGRSWIGNGPLCPEHKLPVDVKKLDSYREGNKYEFHCPGPEGENGHTIQGPEFSQLVGSENSSSRDPNIYRDVNARIKAKELKNKL